MEQDISWWLKMLNTLYKKLNLFFISSMMIIITLLFIFFSISNFKTERTNEMMFFQRMSTLLNFQIENDNQDITATLKEFEQKYDIFLYLQNEQKELLYQSEQTFSMDTTNLLNQLNQQTEQQESIHLSEHQTTTQGGIFEFDGLNNDTYLAIPSIIVSKNNNTYHMFAIMKQTSSIQFITSQLPTYLCLWFISLLGVSLVCHFLLKKAFEPTQQGLKSQKDFIASASHELKNPLSILLANVEKIERFNIQHPQLQTSLHVMDNECMRMSKLIQDMLLLVSSDSNTWTLHKEPIDIDTLLINIYESYESICKQNGMSVHIDLSKDQFPRIITDKERLFQILCIFMDNAITHSHHHSNIEIETELTSKFITFFIIDHGLGISSQDKPYIFNRFFCGDTSHANKSNFGLGLSIAHELASMLHGKVGFKDTPGGGATFFITLPLM